MGKLHTDVEQANLDAADFVPRVIPELQYKSVISVVLGDYHYGALTSTGKLLTWGAYSNGALGLGDPKDIEPGQHNQGVKHCRREKGHRTHCR